MADTPTRERIKAFVAKRYSTRVHMSLILSACGLTAMTTSWTLLHYGVHSMLLRYPLAMGMAYAMFLIGVWTWLRATGLIEGNLPEGRGAARAKGSGGGLDFDIPTPSAGGGGGGGGARGILNFPRGGGGTFDGGGASASFDNQAVAAVRPTAGGDSIGSRIGGSLFDGIDGDGIVLLVLAAVLALVVFATSGYLIWCAPDVLTEAAFGAALTGTLHGAAREHAQDGWVGGVVRKTWWPFALVLVAALAFAGWSAAHYPECHTFRQAITAAIHS